MEDIIETNKTVKYLRHVMDHERLATDYYFKTPKCDLVAEFCILH